MIHKIKKKLIKQSVETVGISPIYAKTLKNVLYCSNSFKDSIENSSIINQEKSAWN